MVATSFARLEAVEAVDLEQFCAAAVPTAALAACVLERPSGPSADCVAECYALFEPALERVRDTLFESADVENLAQVLAQIDPELSTYLV